MGAMDAGATQFARPLSRSTKIGEEITWQKLSGLTSRHNKCNATLDTIKEQAGEEREVGEGL